MQQGNRDWVTLIECISATGIRLPASCIYAGTAHYKGWHSSEAIASETVFATSKQHGQNPVSIHSTILESRPIPTILFSFRLIPSPHHHRKASDSYRTVLRPPLLKSKSSRLRYQQQLKKDRLKSNHSEVLLLGSKLS
jgi:hypothetical protein